MDEQQRRVLESYGGPGSEVKFKIKGEPDKRRAVGVVDDHVFIIVQDYKQFIQRIRLYSPDENDASEFAYRFGYYTWAADGSSVKFGQFHPLITQRQIQALLDQARAKQWPEFSSSR